MNFFWIQTKNSNCFFFLNLFLSLAAALELPINIYLLLPSSTTSIKHVTPTVSDVRSQLWLPQRCWQSPRLSSPPLQITSSIIKSVLPEPNREFAWRCTDMKPLKTAKKWKIIQTRIPWLTFFMTYWTSKTTSAAKSENTKTHCWLW